MTNTIQPIFKVCDIDLWQDAKRAGVFEGAEIDLVDGYIHFSTASQLPDTLVHHFGGRDDLVLLAIDTTQLNIVWEPARGGDLFPHLYDNLPLSCIVDCQRLQLSVNGTHIIPEKFLYQLTSNSALLTRSCDESGTGVP